MVVNGDREAGVEPSLWREVSIEFHLYGKVVEDKAVKAAELSINKYCSVAATLVKTGAQIKWKVFVHSA
jgi:putative redox protein